MPEPTPYSRLNAYTDHSVNFPSQPHRGQDLDQDFDAIALSIVETQQRLGLIQREDGLLADGVVTPESLSDAARAALGGIGPQGPAGPAIPGPAGPPGPTGSTLPWLTGTTVPSNLLGVEGQLYLNSLNGDAYSKEPSGWVFLLNLRGPAGVGGGGGSGVSDHGALTGLLDPDHAISSIQGLQAELDSLQSQINSIEVETSVTYFQDSAPTASLNAGDLWFDTSDANRLYRWNGASWDDVQEALINEQAAQLAELALQVADVANQADGRTVTFVEEVSPDAPFGPIGAKDGDFWYIPSSKTLYIRRDGQFTVLQDQLAIAAIQSAATAQATADGKIVTFAQPSAPPLSESSFGDIWIDTNDNNQAYRYNGASWVSIRDGLLNVLAQSLSAALQDIGDLQTQADSVVEIFYLPTEPNNPDTGDLWVDEGNGNVLKRWNGAQWVTIQDEAITTAITAAADAANVADGKIAAYYQTTAPGSPDTGDIWFDSDDNNRPYRWSGSAWTDISNIQGVVDGLVTAASIPPGELSFVGFEDSIAVANMSVSGGLVSVDTSIVVPEAIAKEASAILVYGRADYTESDPDQAVIDIDIRASAVGLLTPGVYSSNSFSIGNRIRTAGVPGMGAAVFSAAIVDVFDRDMSGIEGDLDISVRGTKTFDTNSPARNTGVILSLVVQALRR